MTHVGTQAIWARLQPPSRCFGRAAPDAGHTTRGLRATLGLIVAPTRVDLAARSTSSFSGQGSTNELNAYLRSQVEDLQNRLATSAVESRDLIASEKVEAEKLRGELALLRKDKDHELELLRQEKAREIGDLKERQAADGLDFLLKNRTISARGAMEWAEREVRRRRFPGQEVTRREVWHYVSTKNQIFLNCAAELGRAGPELTDNLVRLYGKVSDHIHDRQSPQVTASHPIIVLREESGEGFLTKAEAELIKCICQAFCLSYDAYSRDPKSGAISTQPEKFRALSDEDIEKRVSAFYSLAEADARQQAAKSFGQNAAPPGRRGDRRKQKGG